MRTSTCLMLTAAALSSTLAMAIELPDMKAGLWESSTTMGAATRPVRATMCMDNAGYQRLHEQVSRNLKNPCRNIDVQHTGSVYTTTTQCQFGSGKPSVSTTVLTMSGNTAYHSEMRASDHTVEMIIDARFLGACPAGMKVGDMTGPDGKFMMNVLE